MLVPQRQFLNFFKKNFQKELTLKFSPFLTTHWNPSEIFSIYSPNNLLLIIKFIRPGPLNEIFKHIALKWWCTKIGGEGKKWKWKINVRIPALIRRDKICDPHCLLYTGPVSPVRSKESWPTTRWQLYLCFHCNWICFDMAFYQVTIVCIALQELCF